MTRGGDAFSRLVALEGAGRRRGGPQWIALAAVVALPALAFLALWRFADGRSGGTEALQLRPDPATEPTGQPATALRTGLISFRRLPERLADDASSSRLRADLDSFAAGIGDRSCLSVSLDGDRVVVAGAARRVIPASSMKILVAAVALERLGRDFRFTTTLTGTVEGEIVTGDLHLVGGGDPLLTSDRYPIENDGLPVFNETSFDDLAEQLAGAGVTRVTGDVVGDGSRYDDELYAPDWAPGVRGVEAGPVDALLVNDARVTGDPNRAEDPSLGGARELIDVLAANGIVVDGSARAGAAASDAAQLAAVESAPLHAVVAELLTTSDNNTAESLLKELGRSEGRPGSRQAGLAVMREQLEEWGAHLTGTTLTDASGLSPTNLVTCGVLQTVLVESGHGDDLAAGMPRAAETGALTDVFVGSPVAGRLVAKTGTLGNPPFDVDPPAAKGLVGYLPSGRRQQIQFSMVLNGPTIDDPGQYLPLWDGLVAVLASYPAGPPASELAPR